MWNCRGRMGHQARLQLGESIRSSPLATAIRRDLTNKNVSKQAHCMAVHADDRAMRALLFWISGDLVRISGSNKYRCDTGSP